MWKVSPATSATAPKCLRDPICPLDIYNTIRRNDCHGAYIKAMSEAADIPTFKNKKKLWNFSIKKTKTSVRYKHNKPDIALGREQRWCNVAEASFTAGVIVQSKVRGRRTFMANIIITDFIHWLWILSRPYHHRYTIIIGTLSYVSTNLYKKLEILGFTEKRAKETDTDSPNPIY